MPDAPWTLMGLHAAVRFSLVAEPAPGLLPRLLAAFARRDLVPDSVEARREGEEMHVEIGLAAMPAEMVHLVAGNLRQTVGVLRLAHRQEVTGMARRRAA